MRKRIYHHGKTWLFLFFLFHFTSMLHAQDFPYSFTDAEIGESKVVDVKNATYYGGKGDEEIKDIAIHSDGTIYFIGKTSSDEEDAIASPDSYQENLNGTLSDAFLVKMDPTGKIREWGTYFGQDKVDEGNALAIDETGVYIITIIQTNDNGKDIVVMKFDHSGRKAWNEPYHYPSSSHDEGIDIAVNDHAVYCVGNISELSNNGVIFKLDKNTGQKLSEKIFKNPSPDGEAGLFKASSIHIASDNTIYVGGIAYTDLEFDTGTIGNGVFLLKLSENLDLDWSNSFSNLNKEKGTQHIASNNNLLIFGVCKGSSNNNIILYKINKANGNEEILKNNFGGSEGDYILDLEIDNKNRISVIGWTASDTGISESGEGIYQTYFGGELDVFLTKFDINGNIIWSTYFGSTATDQGYALGINSGGAIYATGMASSQNNIATDEAYDNTYNGAKDGFFAAFHDLFMVKHPKSLKVGLGETANFSALAEGTVTGDLITCQWYKKNGSTWSQVSGANSQDFIIDNAQVEDEGDYMCLAYSSTLDAVVYSKVANLKVITVEFDPLICLGETSTLSTVNFEGNDDVTDVTYTWTAIPSATAGFPVNTDTHTITVSPTFAGVYRYTAVVEYIENGEAKRLEVSAEVEALPIPHVDHNSLNTAFCSGEETDIRLKAIYQYDVNDTDPNNQQDANNWKDDPDRKVNFFWTIVQNANIEGATDGRIDDTRNIDTETNIIKQILQNKTYTDQQIVYNIGVENVEGMCPTDPPVSITVWALPEVEAGPNLELCDESDRIELENYSPLDAMWTGDGVEEDNGTYYFNPALTNASQEVRSVVYTITPITTSSGCEGASTTLEISVTPTPILEPVANPIILCSGVPTTIPLVGTENAEFYWKVIVDNSNIEGQSESSSKSVWNLELINKSTSEQKITFELYPILDGCEGEKQTVEVTVLPENTLTLNTTTPEICSGEVVSVNVSTEVEGISPIFEWRIINKCQNIEIDQESGTLTGETSAVLFEQEVRNNGSTTETITVEVIMSTDDCAGDTKQILITIDPIPTAEIEGPSVIEICGGESHIIKAKTVSNANYQCYKGEEKLDGETASSYEATSAGLYKVEVTTNGCSAISDSFELKYKSTQQAEIIGLTKSEFCYSDIIDVTLSSKDPAALYSWYKNGALVGNEKDLQVTEAGEYVLIISDASGCGSLPDTVTILQFEEPAVQITADQLKFCIDEFISTRLKTLNVPQAASYQWQLKDKNTGEFNNISDAIKSTYVATVLGEYRVEITTAQGCSKVSSSLTLTNHPEVDAGEDVSVCQLSSIVIGTQSAVPNHYTYSWTPLDSQAPVLSNSETYAPSVTPLEMHLGDYEYEVLVTDTNTGCESKDIVVVHVDALPQISIVADGKTDWCGGETIDVTLRADVSNLGETGDVTYNWTNESGSQLSTSQSVEVNAVGEYFLEVTTVDGACIQTTSQVITQTGLVDPVILIDGVEIDYKEICFGESVMLSIKNYDPAIIYEWIDENGVSLGTDKEINVNISQKYTVVARPNTDCEEQSNSVEIKVKDLPLAKIITSDPTDFCIGEEISITLSSEEINMDVYQWYKDGVAILGATTLSLNVTEAGSYTLTVIKDGCTSEVSNSIEVINHPYPSASINADQLSFCAGVPIEANMEVVSDFGTIYNWQKEDVSGQFVDLGETSATYQATETGIYRVEISSIYSCKTISEVKEVKVIDLPSIKIEHGAPVICENDFAILSAPEDPSFSYTWYKDGVEIQGENTSKLTVTETASYYVEVAQDTGGGNVSCSGESNAIMITVQPLPTINITPVDELCQFTEHQLIVTYSPNDVDAGVIELAEWRGEDVTKDGIFTPIKGNMTYTLTFHYKFKYAEAISSCEQTASIDIWVNELEEIDLSNVPTSFCNTDISINLDQYGPYTNGEGTGIWTGLGVKGNILNPSEAVDENGGNTGEFTLTYTFTDIKGCTVSENTILTISEPSTVSAGDDQEMCINDIDLTMQGASPANGIWSMTASGATITEDGVFTPTRTGTFTVSYTYGDGSCQVTDEKEVIVYEIPQNSAGNDLEVCLNDEAFELVGRNGAISIDGNIESWTGTGIIEAENGLFDPAVAGVGIHMIVFESTNPTTGCTNIDTTQVVVHELPTPNFDVATDAAYCVGEEVIFENTTPELDGYVLNYRWDFGDGQGSTEKDGVHTYSDVADAIEVTLYASTNKGCEVSITKTIKIVESPEALFTLDHDVNTCTPVTVFFTNESKGYSPNYYWDFGNGMTSIEENPNPISYVNPSYQDTTYYIILTVNNICGYSEYRDSITVQALPVVDFIVNKDTVCADKPLELANLSLGSVDLYQWNFGDGTPIYETTSKELVYHAFENEGKEHIVRTVTLTAYNDCGKQVQSKNIVVKPKELTAFFNISTQKGCEGTEVEFVSNQIGEHDIFWDFGDGNTQEGGITTKYIYEESGVYDVVLTISNGFHSDTYTQSLEILPSPDPTFTYSGDVCLGEYITFTNTSEAAGVHTWDFGDGTTYTGETPPAKLYADAGVYEVTLFITDAQNSCVGRFVQTIQIFENPTVAFDVPSIICSYETVTLTADSPTAVAWEWVLADGRTFSGEEVEVVFNESQEITLTVYTAHNCTATLTKYVEVTEDSIPENWIPSDLQVYSDGEEYVCAEPIAGVTLHWMKDGNQLTSSGEACVTVSESVTVQPL